MHDTQSLQRHRIEVDDGYGITITSTVLTENTFSTVPDYEY